MREAAAPPASSQTEETGERKKDGENRATEADAMQRRDEAAREPMAQGGAPAAAPAMALAKPKAVLGESAKIDRLIAYVGQQQGLLISNGEEYPPGYATQLLRHRREQLGDRVRTADDFIRLCASRSPATGEDFLIRYADGQTRRAEDALREELERISGN